MSTVETFLDTIIDSALLAQIQSKHIKIHKQFYLLDHTDTVQDDITKRVTACKIEHMNFRNVHRTIDVDIRGSLQWGYHRIKPYVSLETPAGQTPFMPLGVFLLTAPEEDSSTKPTIYNVTGYDKGYILDQLLANAFTAEQGQPVIETVDQLLQSHGIEANTISPMAGSELITSSRSWSIIEDVSALVVLNTLLGTINYRGLYFTPNGEATSEYYLPPDVQPITWAYNPLHNTTNVLTQRVKTNDFTTVPNRFIFWIANIEQDTIPELGNGLYVYDNINEGPSSQQQRGNLVITHKEGLEVLNQTELIAAATRIIKEHLQSQTRIRFQTTLNPLHGHFDVMEFDDSDSGIYGKFQHLSWSMDLFTGIMDHEVRSVETI